MISYGLIHPRLSIYIRGHQKYVTFYEGVNKLSHELFLILNYFPIKTKKV